MNVAALDLPCGGPFRAMELAIDIQNYVKFFLVWFLLYTNNMPMLQELCQVIAELCQVIKNSLISGVLGLSGIMSSFFIYSSVDKNYVKFFYLLTSQ